MEESKTTMGRDETKTMGPSSPGHLTPADSRLPGPHLGPGATVGRYVVLYRVGSGGMAVVYAAYDPELDRKVALKIQRGNLGSDLPPHVLSANRNRPC